MKYSMCPQLLRRALGLDFWLHDFGNHKKLPFVNLTVTSLNSALPGLFGPPEYFTEQNYSRLTIMLSCPTGPSFVKIFRFVHISLEFSLRFSFLSQFFPTWSIGLVAYGRIGAWLIWEKTFQQLELHFLVTRSYIFNKAF